MNPRRRREKKEKYLTIQAEKERMLSNSVDVELGREQQVYIQKEEKNTEEEKKEAHNDGVMEVYNSSEESIDPIETDVGDLEQFAAIPTSNSEEEVNDAIEDKSDKKKKSKNKIKSYGMAKHSKREKENE